MINVSWMYFSMWSENRGGGGGRGSWETSEASPAGSPPNVSPLRPRPQVSRWQAGTAAANLQQTAPTSTLIIRRQHRLRSPPTRLGGTDLSYLSYLSYLSSLPLPPPGISPLNVDPVLVLQDSLMSVSSWPHLSCLFKVVTWPVCIN